MNALLLAVALGWMPPVLVALVVVTRYRRSRARLESLAARERVGHL